MLALLLGMVLAGCTSTRPLPLARPGERAAFNAQAEGTEARIAFVDGTASIRYVDRGRGALEGTGLGLVGGGLLGGLAGSDGGPEPGEMELVTPEQVILGVAIIGTAIGAVVGMARGHRTVYRVSPQRPGPDREAGFGPRAETRPATQR